MSMTYIAPQPHVCPLPKDTLGRPPYPAGSVWTCMGCDTGWVVRLTQEWPPRRIWKQVRWWHFAARRQLRDRRQDPAMSASKPLDHPRFVRVERVKLGPDRGRWFVFCDVCGDDFLGFSFWPLRWAQDQLTAVRWAHQHARRHHEQACPCCGHMKPIKDLDVVGRAAS